LKSSWCVTISIPEESWAELEAVISGGVSEPQAMKVRPEAVRRKLHISEDLTALQRLRQFIVSAHGSEISFDRRVNT
jgi:hypothetical protein